MRSASPFQFSSTTRLRFRRGAEVGHPTRCGYFDLIADALTTPGDGAESKGVAPFRLLRRLTTPGDAETPGDGAEMGRVASFRLEYEMHSASPPHFRLTPAAFQEREEKKA